MNIVAILPEQTYALRHAVLWPDKPLEYVKVPDDADGFHFGVVRQEQIIAVISLFCYGEEARFRKFATASDYQRKGVGSQLLHHVMEVARQQGCRFIWCDARLDAKVFYQRFGMSQDGDIFYKGSIPYVKMLKFL
ncbi:MAG: GNAT family N-acetyltransferase [Spirosomataceae bacterium]